MLVLSFQQPKEGTLEKTVAESPGSAVRVAHAFPRVTKLYLFPDPPLPTTQAGETCPLCSSKSVFSPWPSGISCLQGAPE